MKLAIELNNVTAGYNTGHPIISDVNLSVNEREFLGIIGPNGGGKTTLLKVILGLLAPSKGKVLIGGKANNRKDYKIGYVPQYSNFDKTYPISVKSVVSMGLRSARKLTNEEKLIVENSLEQVNLLNKMNSSLCNIKYFDFSPKFRLSQAYYFRINL